MIGVVLEGRLGNQMFAYAFAYVIAKKNKTVFFLAKNGRPIELYKYFRLEKNVFYITDRMFFNTPKLGLLFSHYIRRAFYGLIMSFFIEKDITIDNRDHPRYFDEVSNQVLYHGYFQSPIYFQEYNAEIKKCFSIKQNYLEKYRRKFSHFFKKKIVAVHIRKTDYSDLEHLNLGKKDLSLPMDYFQNLIKDIHNVDNFYIFLSDDIENIKPHFRYLKNAYFSSDSVINDFLHMFYANTIIISNSTFSWWAAYLNNQQNKTVYCPKYFLGYAVKEEYPSNIYPKDWIQIEVINSK